MADRSVNVRLRLLIGDFERGADRAAAKAAMLGQSLDTADSHGSRLVQTVLALAPAAVPLGGALVPAIAGVTVGLGAAAAAAGVSLLAFQGVGDALDALNKFQLDPTAENLAAMQEKMQTLGPAGRDFVRTLQDLRPELQGLQDLAQAGLFPGLEDSIDELMQNGPLVERFITDISTTLGDLASKGADRLNDSDWQDFFRFIDAEAGPTLTAFAKSTGLVVEGLANMIMASAPLEHMFTGGMLSAAKSFQQWSENLAASDGFRGFVDYIRSNGPEAMETLGAVAEALVSLVEAAAPVGSVLLPVIKVLANVLSDVADSPIGPILVGAAAGLSAVSRAVALFKAANGSAIVTMFKETKTSAAESVSPLKAVAAAELELVAAQEAAAAASLRNRDAQFALIPTSGKRAALNEYMASLQTVKTAEEGVAKAQAARGAALRENFASFGKGAGLAGAFALSMTDLDDKMGISNTAMLTMAGTMLGPWGAAAGFVVGAIFDITAANDDLEASMQRVDDAFSGSSAAEQKASLEALRQEIEKTKEAADFSDAATSSGFINVDLLNVAKAAWLHLSGAVGDAEAKLKDVQSVASAKGLSTLMLGQLDGIRAGFENTTAAVKDFEDAFNHLNNMLSDVQTLVDYQRALDDLRKSLQAPGDKNKNFDPNFERGRSQLEALNHLMQATEDRAVALAKQGKTLDAQHMLTTAIGDLERMRKRFPALKGVTDGLLAELKRLEGKYEATVDVNDGPAHHKIDATSSRLERLRAMETVPTINADDKPAAHKVDGVKGLLRQLGGTTATPKIDASTSGLDAGVAHARSALAALAGTTVTTFINTVRNIIPGGHADGGQVRGPGGPRDDKIPARLSDREWVMPVDAVDYYGPGFMSAVQTRRFADGGMAGRSRGRDPLGFVSANTHTHQHQVDQEAFHLANTLKGLRHQLKDTQKELEKEKDARSKLVDKMQAFRSSVHDSFNNSPFLQGGLEGFNLQLTADRDDALAMKKALNRARQHGLSGGLFNAIAASGDLTTAQQFAGLSKGQIKREEQLFSQAQAARGDLAGFATNQRFGDALKDSNKAVRELRHELQQIRKHLPKNVEDGARKGVADRDRRTAQRSRAGR